MNEQIRKAKEGDSEAFEALIRSQMQTLYKTARATLRNDEDAADAIQETILTCWEKLGTLREERYFRTWLVRILINKCRDILRQRERVYLADVIPETGRREEEYLNAEWREALGALDEKYRTVMVLYYVEQFKTSEIAHILEIPETTVRTRLSRGREKLQTIYGANRNGRISPFRATLVGGTVTGRRVM